MKELCFVRDKLNVLTYTDVPALKRTLRDVLGQGLDREDKLLNRLTYVEGT